MSSSRSSARRRAVLRARRRRRAGLILLLTGVVVAAAILLPRAFTPETSTVAGAERPSPVVTAPSSVAEESPEATPSATPDLDPCDIPAVAEALTSGSDDDVIDAFGGAHIFRAAVASGDAPCVDLHEADRLWVVVNKRNALDPLEYWPTPQARPQATRIIAGGYLLERTAAALDELSAAAADAGAGAIAVSSGFRPYDFQVETYRRQVADRGQAGADLRSARPGHSEHQTGLAVDVVACDAAGCGDHDGFGGTSQSDWIVANAWRFGFIVRYESDRTMVTGYSPEPWHLRFVGQALAAAYHEGGYTTLEEFFGLEPAPDYG